jgi:hypothetical protein
MIITREQKLTLVFVGVLIIGAIVFKISSCNKPDIQYGVNTSEFEIRINDLDKRIKKQEADRKKTDSLIVVLQDSMTVLKYAIKSKDQQIKNLKAKHEKERIDISKFTNADIQKFLSDRYGKR